MHNGCVVFGHAHSLEGLQQRDEAERAWPSRRTVQLQDEEAGHCVPLMSAPPPPDTGSDCIIKACERVIIGSKVRRLIFPMQGCKDASVRARILPCHVIILNSSS